MSYSAYLRGLSGTEVPRPGLPSPVLLPEPRHPIQHSLESRLDSATRQNQNMTQELKRLQSGALEARQQAAEMASLQVTNEQLQAEVRQLREMQTDATHTEARHRNALLELERAHQAALAELGAKHADQLLAADASKRAAVERAVSC